MHEAWMLTAAREFYLVWVRRAVVFRKLGMLAEAARCEAWAREYAALCRNYYARCTAS